METSKQSVLVIGGNGFLGRRVIGALRRAGLSPVAAGRRPRGPEQVKLDLRDASTFGAMDDFDLVVDCADALVAPPAAAFDHCLRRGGIFVETTAEPRTTFELLDRRTADGRAGSGSAALPGLGIVGVGLFPGLSNLLARHLYDALDACSVLDVGVRLSPLSAAGPGMCALIADMVTSPTPRVEHGLVVEGPSFRSVGPFPFAAKADDEVHTSIGLTLSLPESVMLHHSTGVPSSRSVIAMRPELLGLPLRALGRLAPALGKSPLAAALRALLRWQLLALRSGLLRRRPTRVELSAVAHGPDGRGCHVHLAVDDGIGATAELIAATVLQVLATPTSLRGARLVDEVTELEPTLNLFEALAGRRVERHGLEPRPLASQAPDPRHTVSIRSWKPRPLEGPQSRI